MGADAREPLSAVRRCYDFAAGAELAGAGALLSLAAGLEDESDFSDLLDSLDPFLSNALAEFELFPFEWESFELESLELESEDGLDPFFLA